MNALQIGRRIKLRREELDLTQGDLAESLGFNKSTIQRYETGQVQKIKIPVLQLMAKSLNVNPDWLACKTDDKSEYPSQQYLDNNPFTPNISEEHVTFPVIGEIAAGYDRIAIQDWEGDVIDIPVSYLHGRSKEDYFVLKVKGDSMYPAFMEGDKVMVLKQDALDYSGQVGVILYNDDNATLKKVEFRQGEDWLRLVPINPTHPTVKVANEELEHCRVLGVPKLLIRNIGD